MNETPVSYTTQSSFSLKNIIIVILGLVLIIISFFVGMFLGKGQKTNFTPPGNVSQLSHPFFEEQSVSFQGKITKVLGNKITFERVDKQVGEFELSDKVAITNFNGSATASSDLEKIQLNKNASIALDLKTIKVASISYLPEINSINVSPLPLPKLPNP